MADKEISALTAVGTPLDGTELVHVVEGGNSRKATTQNIADLAEGIPSGNAFPGSPASGDRFYRDDRNIDYFYDGTRWLSTNKFVLELGLIDALYPKSATSAAASSALNPWSGLYDMYVEETATWTLMPTAGNWTVAVVSIGTGAATLSSYVISVAATEVVTRTNVNAVVPSTIVRFNLSVTENSGTSGFYALPSIIYRLVG